MSFFDLKKRPNDLKMTPELGLAVVKEESRRAGINHRHHPKFAQ